MHDPACDGPLEDLAVTSAMEPESAALLWILASLFLEEPPFALAEQLAQGAVSVPSPPDDDGELAAGLEALTSFARLQVGRDAGQVHTELRQEYAALFIGPRPRVVHPYESVYRDSLHVGGRTFQGLLMGESVDQVRAFWTEAGIQCINPHNYPPDHVGLELGFVAYMAQELLASGDERYLVLARRFLQEHLLAWIPRFCTELYALDTARFYKPVSQLTQGLIGTLAKRMGVAISHLPGGRPLVGMSSSAEF